MLIDKTKKMWYNNNRDKGKDQISKTNKQLSKRAELVKTEKVGNYG